MDLDNWPQRPATTVRTTWAADYMALPSAEVMPRAQH